MPKEKAAYGRPFLLQNSKGSVSRKTEDVDDDEALSDFRRYAIRMKNPLAKAGIQFEEVYAGSFRVQLRSETQFFHPTSGVGYYFVAPGKRAQVEYGVMTDTDLLVVAKRYFGLATPQK